MTIKVRKGLMSGGLEHRLDVGLGSWDVVTRQLTGKLVGIKRQLNHKLCWSFEDLNALATVHQRAWLVLEKCKMVIRNLGAKQVFRTEKHQM